METIQTAISSPRFNRVMMFLGATILVAGIVVFLFRIAGGSSNVSPNAAAGFKPALPANSTPLKNANGVTVKRYEQLDPAVRSNIRTFLTTAVARKNLGASWAVIAPSMKSGYTYKSWKNATALPIIPYQISSINNVTYSLKEAASKEILVDLGLTAPPALKIRPTRFRVGLVPVGKGAQKQWLVNYWMPLWTPVLPQN
jgi:hypothetical protein